MLTFLFMIINIADLGANKYVMSKNTVADIIERLQEIWFFSGNNIGKILARNFHRNHK